MVLLGLILLALGALAIVAALFSLDGSTSLLGVDDVSATVIFFVGLGAGVAIWWGFALARLGARRSMQQRRERKRMEDLSSKLDEVDYDRRKDGDEHEDRSTF